MKSVLTTRISRDGAHQRSCPLLFASHTSRQKSEGQRPDPQADSGAHTSRLATTRLRDVRRSTTVPLFSRSCPLWRAKPLKQQLGWLIPTAQRVMPRSDIVPRCDEHWARPRPPRSAPRRPVALFDGLVSQTNQDAETRSRTSKGIVGRDSFHHGKR